MSSFASLKKNSKSQFDKLINEVQKLNAPAQGSQDDNRFWKPEVDKAGNGYAIIRFLPTPGADGDEGTPYVRIWDHGFQGPGGWYIEKSLTTLGQKDPVSEYNSQLWNSGIEANKELVRKYKRRLSFISNIYVVKDPAHPENEGKVMLFKYGKKIWDKIELAMNPEFEDEVKINPFDFWDGANFKLKIRKVEGYRNYDKSEFEPKAPLMEDDDELENVWKQEHSLAAFVDPKEFKSYDELKTRLNKALGLDGSPAAARTTAAESKAAPWDDPEPVAQAPVQRTAAAAPAPVKSLEPAFDDDDENMDFFKRLAEED
jgi:hypothetical protein